MRQHKGVALHLFEPWNPGSTIELLITKNFQISGKDYINLNQRMLKFTESLVNVLLMWCWGSIPLKISSKIMFQNMNVCVQVGTPTVAPISAIIVHWNAFIWIQECFFCKIFHVPLPLVNEDEPPNANQTNLLGLKNWSPPFSTTHGSPFPHFPTSLSNHLWLTCHTLQILCILWVGHPPWNNIYRGRNFNPSPVDLQLSNPKQFSTSSYKCIYTNFTFHPS